MNHWRKDIASWKCGKTLYLSVPFTWLLPKAEEMAKAHKGKVVAGGPAVDLAQSGAPNTPEPITWAETPESCPFDTLAMHNPFATFTTGGCPNCCEFCAVPKIEGEFWERKAWKPAPMVCDNNILESSKAHFRRVIDSLLPFPSVDFNQGLDARKFVPFHADQLARLRRCKLRFAFDDLPQEPYVRSALELARRWGFRDFGIYVLIGFNDSPEGALYRLKTVCSWGIRPTPMRYQPLDALEKNVYVASGWTERELCRMMKYYSRLRWLEHIPFDEFKYLPESDIPLFEKIGRE